MMKRTIPPFIAYVLVVAMLSCGAGAAFAQSLNSLRASGAVGERFDGYAEALDASAAGMVSKINGERRAIYSKRAAEQGITADQVGKIYAREIFKKLPSGAPFLQENGQRIRK